MKHVDLTVDQVVAIVKKCGHIEVNPLKYRKWRGTNAAFKAAKLGLLDKLRMNCGRFIFTLPEQVTDTPPTHPTPFP